MKRILSVMLILAMLLGVLPFAASAAKLIGDVNEDAAVNAKDVTILRRYIAEGYGVTIDEGVGNTNRDGEVNAKDVTTLRRYLAGGYGVELGTLAEAKQASYTDAVTGGQVYTDLGEPKFGDGVGEYSLTVLVDGKEDAAAAKAIAEKIVSGNAEEITPNGSTTEVASDPGMMRVTVSTMRHYAAKIAEVYPAENGNKAYVTLSKVDWNPVPEGDLTLQDGTKVEKAFATDAFTATDVGAYVVYTKSGDSIKTVEKAETKHGSGAFATLEDGTPTDFELDGTSYPVASVKPALENSGKVGTVRAEPVAATVCLDANGNVICAAADRKDFSSVTNKDERFSMEIADIEETVLWNAMMCAAAKADREKGDSRTMPAGVPETVKLLIIGNSFGNDCSLTYLHHLLADAGVKNVTVGTLYYSGCPYNRHVAFGMTDRKVYDYYKNSSTVIANTATLDDAVEDEDWTHIMMLSKYTDKPEDFGQWQDLLLLYVRSRCPDAYYGYDMTWAFRGDYGDPQYTSGAADHFRNYHNGDQMTMYNNTINLVNTKVLVEPRFKFVVPAGTAIQNARTSFIGDHMDRDGYHLNKGIGRYTAQMTVCCLLTGVDPNKISYVSKNLISSKDDYAIPEQDMARNGMLDMLGKVARESAKNALAKPFEITDSRYGADEVLWPGENEMPIN